MATAGVAIKDPGDVVLDAAGNEIICDDGTACCGGIVCAACASAPGPFLCTFSGITNCTTLGTCSASIVGAGCNIACYKINTMNINAAFCVPAQCSSTTTQCIYTYLFNSAVSVDYMCAAGPPCDCLTVTCTLDMLVLNVIIFKSATPGKFKIRVVAYMAKGPFTLGTDDPCTFTGFACFTGPFSAQIFDGTSGDLNDCATTATITNGLTACTGTDIVRSGSVTVVPAGC